MTNKFRRFFQRLKAVIEYQQLDADQRRLTFYSEGKNYWPHLEGIVMWLLHNTDIPVCYISSSAADPGLLLDHPDYRSFEVGEGFVRNWFFENLQTRVLVMTMPDIGRYQVKRSRHPVYYVYLQHSLVSLHMVYREGAFDHYDAIFCAGPHHVAEVRAIERQRKLAAKHVFAHGYSRLDAIIRQSGRDLQAPDKSTPRPGHILIAPSWGPHGLIESGLAKTLVADLVGSGYHVTFRPHPQTIRFAQQQVDEIVRQHRNNSLFLFEDNVAGWHSLQESDLLVSDWSGVALEYALGLGKPVLFVDVPRKVNNPAYQEISLEPIEVKLRPRLGYVHDPVKPLDLEMDMSAFEIARAEEFVFNVGSADEVGGRELVRILHELLDA